MTRRRPAPAWHATVVCLLCVLRGDAAGPTKQVAKPAKAGPAKWESWKHKTLDADAAIVKQLEATSAELSPATATTAAASTSTASTSSSGSDAGGSGGEKLSKAELAEQSLEERALGESLRAELMDGEANRFGRWSTNGDAAAGWLGREAKLARSDIAFGVVASAANAVHLGLLKHWWLVGSSGCIFADHDLNSGRGRLDSAVFSALRLPAGLGPCLYPAEWKDKAWFQVHGEQARAALAPLALARKFPGKLWYVVGDGDTLFNPLALAQWLQNFDYGDDWYLGGRSEAVDRRRLVGWDAAAAGGGAVFSGGLLGGSAAALERCFEVAPWGSPSSGGQAAEGGDVVLRKCLARLGVPLTPCGGFHRMDSRDPLALLDALERHPVAPLLSVHNAARLFHVGGGRPQPMSHRFFGFGMWHDPVAFGQLTMAEVRGEGQTYTGAVSSGVSVRLWRGEQSGLLWHGQTRGEPVFAGLGKGERAAERLVSGDEAAVLRYSFSGAQQSSANERGIPDGVTISIYEPRNATSGTTPLPPTDMGRRRLRQRSELSERFNDEAGARRVRRSDTRRGRGDLRGLARNRSALAQTEGQWQRWDDILRVGGAWEGTKEISDGSADDDEEDEDEDEGGRGGTRRLGARGGAVGGMGLGTSKVRGHGDDAHKGQARAAQAAKAAQLKRPSRFPYLFVIVAEVRQPNKWVGGPRKLCHANTHEIAYRPADDGKELGDSGPVGDQGGGKGGGGEGRRREPKVRAGRRRALLEQKTDDYENKEAPEADDEGARGALAMQGLVLMLGLDDCAEVFARGASNGARRPFPFPSKEAIGRLVERAAGLPPGGSVLHRMMPSPELPFIKSGGPALGGGVGSGAGSGGAPESGGSGPPAAGAASGEGNPSPTTSAAAEPTFTTASDSPDETDETGAAAAARQLRSRAASAGGERGERPGPWRSTSLLGLAAEAPRPFFNRQGRRLGGGGSGGGGGDAGGGPSLDYLQRCKWVAWKNANVCDPDYVPPASAQSSPPGGPPGKWGQKGLGRQMPPAPKGGRKVKDADLVASTAAGSDLRSFLQDENRTMVSLVFGIISSFETAPARLDLLRLWWVPGARGCLSVNGKGSGKGGMNGMGLLPGNVRSRMPPGLEICATPDVLQAKPWYSEDRHGTHRGAILPLVLRMRFPGMRWYVVGDDDTLFNPLALAQWLQNFDFRDPWYMGGRSEDVSQRLHLGWDMAFGGGGLVLSGGFFRGYTEALGWCYDAAPWREAPGGDWVLHRCLVRLGIPLTAAAGMHQVDLNEASDRFGERMLDVIERHPVAPFLSFHHPSRAFDADLVSPVRFFEGMHHDPTSFLQLLVLEVPRSLVDPPASQHGFTAAVASGVSVRLWPTGGGGQPHEAASALLWDQTRVDVLSWPQEAIGLYSSSTAEAVYKFGHARESGHAVKSLGSAVALSVYDYDRRSGRDGAPGPPVYAFVVVAEERQRNRWVGAPLKFCHAASFELEFAVGAPVGGHVARALLLAVRDCHAPRTRPPKVPTRDELWSLLRAAAGAPKSNDASVLVSRELTAVRAFGRAFL